MKLGECEAMEGDSKDYRVGTQKLLCPFSFLLLLETDTYTGVVKTEAKTFSSNSCSAT